MYDQCARKANFEGEIVYVKREGEHRKWHARTEDGELIYVDKYRHDLQARVLRAGFEYVMPFGE